MMARPRLELAIVMAASLVLPAPRATLIAMPLCGGGVMFIKGGKPAPATPHTACHAACATRRDDDDGD